MTLTTLDWTIVGAYFAVSLAVGIWASKQAGEDTKSFSWPVAICPGGCSGLVWWLLHSLRTHLILFLISFAKMAFQGTGSGGHFYLQGC
ncbi:MAG: hypothetical protein CM1200mP10_07150 [Candidatus Neomarinimicrobiota bacterium]|nr:MAG: hypothetical protein CM1200mP10_07150 [Candidatus Neomarinimicrobiota bacterium]